MDYRPVILGFQYFFQLSVFWGRIIMAHASLTSVPVVKLCLAVQRALIGGIASLGVKG